MGLAAKNAKSAKKTWPMVRLGEVCEKKIKRLRQINDEEFEYIDISSIDRKTKSIISTKEYLRGDAPGRAQQVVDEGDVLVSTVRPNLNAVAVVGKKQKLQRIASTGFCVLRPSANILSEYIFYCVQHDEFIAALVGVAEKAAYPSVTDDEVKSVSIPLPPLSVQREIVARLEKELGEADALAAKFKGIAENADAEFKAELDETFKGLDGARNCFETSCCMKRGEYITRKEARCGNIPVILGGKEPAYFIDRSNHDGECLVISRSGASAGFVSYWNEPIFVTDGFIIEVKENADIRFAYYYYQSLYEQLGKSKNGSAIPHVTGSGIQALGFPGTSLLVQKEIVTKLDAVREKCDRLKAAAERGLRAAEDLRKAILAEAFEQ